MMILAIELHISKLSLDVQQNAAAKNVSLTSQAKELLTELEASGFAQEEMPYCILIDALAKGGKIWEATMLFNDMKEKGVKSDGYAFSIMISALHRGGYREEAKKLAKEFEDQNATYDLVMLNTSLRAYCNTNDTESVMRMLKKMDEINISPDQITFNTLIRYFCKENVYHLAYKTIEDMHTKGHQLNEVLCSEVMVQLGEAGFPSEAFSVYCMMRYSKRTVCKSLHEKVLGILVPAGLLKDAYIVIKDNSDLISPRSLENFAGQFMTSGNINLINDVMKALNHSGWRISQDIFGRAIQRYIQKPDKKQLLLCLLDWMTGQGYSVDSSSRNLLLKNAQLFGQKQLIAEILSKQQAASRATGQRIKMSID